MLLKFILNKLGHDFYKTTFDSELYKQYKKYKKTEIENKKF